MRKLRLLLVVGVLLLVWAGLVAWKFSRPGVTRARGEQIRAGMTRAEVEALLGRRADSGGVLNQVWMGAAGLRIFVAFDTTDARVHDSGILPEEPTLGERLSDFLPW